MEILERNEERLSIRIKEKYLLLNILGWLCTAFFVWQIGLNEEGNAWYEYIPFALFGAGLFFYLCLWKGKTVYLTLDRKSDEGSLKRYLLMLPWETRFAVSQVKAAETKVAKNPKSGLTYYVRLYLTSGKSYSIESYGTDASAAANVTNIINSFLQRESPPSVNEDDMLLDELDSLERGEA